MIDFDCSALRSNELTRLKSALLGGKFLAYMNSSAQETGDMRTVNCRFKHTIVSLHLCKEYLTAVKLKTLFLLSDKELNVLIYRSPCLDEVQSVGKLWQNARPQSYFRELLNSLVYGTPSLILSKEYLNMATFRILVLLLKKSWIFWYIECLPMSL